MTSRRVLVSQTRFPEIDRDAGSQRVDLFIRRLLEDDWSVTFLAAEPDGDPRHAQRLRQMGIPTYVGCDQAEEVVRQGQFDLALLAFWEPASRLLPILRSVSPETQVVIDSIDVHFLRIARRILVSGGALDDAFTGELAAELNTYRAADAVLTVSPEEATLLSQFLGHGRIYDLPLAARMERSQVPFDDRSGMLFVGNFRHLPNGEAVEYLCREIVPRLSPQLMAAHPLSVVGSRLSDVVAAHGKGLPNVKMVGWVPSVAPYLERARVCVVPLLHGAGVKGKVVEALMAGTPVVTTTLGAEGLDVRHGEHLLIADTPDEFADAVAWAMSDDAQWQRMADAGYAHAVATHAPSRVATRFGEILDAVLAPSATPSPAKEAETAADRDAAYYRTMKDAVAEALHAISDTGRGVLVVSRGDEELLLTEAATHFPQAPDGTWGSHPGDSEAAIEHLEALRTDGARYLVVPSSEFWWLHYYGELTAHLDDHYRRIESSDHVVVFDLESRAERESLEPADTRDRPRVLVIGAYEDERVAPPARLIEDLGRSKRFDVRQHWRRESDAAGQAEDAGDAEWLLHLGCGVVLPPGFLDDFMGVVMTLAELGVDRAQPVHAEGPVAGPPVTERLGGILAREIEGTTPLPVLAVRAGAEREGVTALVDAVPVGLTAPIPVDADPLGYSRVLDVFALEGDAPRRTLRRSYENGPPRISVVLATYERPDLVTACLEGFCEQTLRRDDFEVVVVDDGSQDPETDVVLESYASRLPLAWTRIEHAGRSAAKNLALLIARGDLVLFFDDDDRPAPDLLEEHLQAHERHPGEATAVLGHTGWDPDLKVSRLMHYLTEVDRLLFAYGKFEPGELVDWRGFWEGRVSSKRSLHVRHGLHDQRLEYSIDVELAWRLRTQGLEVVYHPAARSVMSRPIDFAEFCRRYEAKGRAQAAMASLHDDPEIREYARVEGALEHLHAVWPQVPELQARIAELERSLNGSSNGAGHDDAEDDALTELHRLYREVFFAHNAKGVAEVLGDATPPSHEEPPVVSVNGSTPVAEAGRNGSGPVAAPSSNGAEPLGEIPQLSIVVPVWSRTPELADMAARTLERVWDVAALTTEVIVVDNGSPIERPFPRARVHRFPENRGVATAWNTGVEMARAPVVAILNSDCMVERGWDEALHEAATTGRRIAFPYTDHCDGEGFCRPDQAGTAGWCFMLTQELLEEIGPFDERFDPAFGEDTDYWHRAWELGIELTPVPAAQVTHARRSSIANGERAEWLLLAHRYKYGWKHGVEPLDAPPYYNREIVEYHCTRSRPASASTA